MDFTSLVAPRLAEERKRMGLSQVEAGEVCGVSREMWGKYERGKAALGGEVLFHFAVAGADVQYILTGQRQGQGIGESAVHQAVLDAVDLLSLEKKVDANQLAKAVVKLAAKSAAPAPAAKNTAQISVGGDFNGQVLDVDTDSFTQTGLTFGGATPRSKKR